MRRNLIERLLHDHVRLPIPRDDEFVSRVMADWEIPASHPLPHRRPHWGWFGGGAMAFCALTVLLVLGFGVRGTVTVDLNPSLVLNINHFGNVIDVQPTNTDGEALVEALEHPNGSIAVVLRSIVETAQSMGYLPEETADPLLIGVSASAWKTEQVLKESIESALADESVTLLCFSKHAPSGDLLFSGLVMKSATGLPDWFPGFSVQESSTTWNPSTTFTTTAATAIYTTTTPVGVDSANATTTLPRPAFDVRGLTETEFVDMQLRWGVSEAKLTMAILVFNAYDTYTLSGDLEFLCRLPVSELYRLYQALP